MVDREDHISYPRASFVGEKGRKFERLKCQLEGATGDELSILQHSTLQYN